MNETAQIELTRNFYHQNDSLAFLRAFSIVLLHTFSTNQNDSCFFQNKSKGSKVLFQVGVPDRDITSEIFLTPPTLFCPASKK